MIKKLALCGISASALLLATSAFAANSTSTVTQSGAGQTAAVDQTGSSNGAVSTITQSDTNNQAAVTQGGSGNQATVNQSQGAFGFYTNPTNQSTSNQQGIGGIVTVLQIGDSTATIGQTNASSGEHAIVFQRSWGNQATIAQGGSNELGLINQENTAGGTGYNNVGSIVQTGSGDGIDMQTGGAVGNLVWRENLVRNDGTNPSDGLVAYGHDGAVINQIGNTNNGAIMQSGVSNFGDVSQEGDNNIGSVIQSGIDHSDAVMYQLGNSNTTNLVQFGVGTAYSTVGQWGNNNQAYVTQAGTNRSTVAQGFAGEFTGGANSNGSYASVSQNNTGGAQNSSIIEQHAASSAYVTQVGFNNLSNVLQTAGSTGSTANVAQYAFNNVSSVTQTSASNLANILQNGSSNTSTVTQGGAGSNTASVSQSTNGNTSTVTQNGSGGSATVNQ